MVSVNTAWGCPVNLGANHDFNTLQQTPQQPQRLSWDKCFRQPAQGQIHSYRVRDIYKQEAPLREKGLSLKKESKIELNTKM